MTKPYSEDLRTRVVAAVGAGGRTGGPINGECFLPYVKEVLALTLSPGDIV